MIYAKYHDALILRWSVSIIHSHHIQVLRISSCIFVHIFCIFVLSGLCLWIVSAYFLHIMQIFAYSRRVVAYFLHIFWIYVVASARTRTASRCHAA